MDEREYYKTAIKELVGSEKIPLVKLEFIYKMLLLSIRKAGK